MLQKRLNGAFVLYLYCRIGNIGLNSTKFYLQYEAVSKQSEGLL